MSDSEHKYFNFPIILLEGFLNDSNTCLINIIDYSLYKFSVKTECYIDKESFRNSADYFEVTLSHCEDSYENGKALYDSIDERTPKASIEVKLWTDFYKNHKTDFEKVCLLAFIALRSIIGRKPYCKTTNNYLLARMDGKSKTVKSDDELSAQILRYSTRRKLDNIKKELQLNWHLRYLSNYNRGFYISFTLKLGKLAEIAESKRPINLEAAQKQKVKRARDEAKRKIEDRTGN